MDSRLCPVILLVSKSIFFCDDSASGGPILPSRTHSVSAQLNQMYLIDHAVEALLPGAYFFHREHLSVSCFVEKSLNISNQVGSRFHGRPTTVLVFQQPRISFLKVEMACRTSWVLDIRKRNLASEALAWVGAPLETGDEALDEAVVIQGHDEPAIRQWRVKPRFSPGYFARSLAARLQQAARMGRLTPLHGPVHQMQPTSRTAIDNSLRGTSEAEQGSDAALSKACAGGA